LLKRAGCKQIFKEKHFGQDALRDRNWKKRSTPSRPVTC
jgi:hypothetical protein